MGNCCRKFVRIFYKRRVLRQYTALDSRAGNVDERADLYDEDIEDGLMNSGISHASSSSQAAITENEKLLLKSKNYAALISSQKAFDDQIDRQLAEQEERLKREEEELTKLRRSRTNQQKPIIKSESEVPWSGGDENTEWNVAGGEDDFDMFLDSVATRDRSKADEEEINDEDFVSGFTPS